MSSSRALVWIGVLIMVAFFYAAGFGAGDYYRNQACMVKDAQQLEKAIGKMKAEVLQAKKANEALQAEVLRSQQAAQEAAQQQDALQTSYRKLEGRYRVFKQKNVPLLSASAPSEARVAGSAGLGDSLSLGAVWMWNSALDPDSVPAAACDSADSAQQTCAAGSAVSLWDAWDNHAVNARSCAEDRLRLQRLIDYLHPTGAIHVD